MISKLKIYILLFLISVLSYAQNEKIIKHTIAQGETITSIAVQYKTTPYKIYILNPEITESIKIGDILFVPVPINLEEKNERNVVKHTVLPKETFYSISKKYDVLIDDIQKWNEEILKEGLQEGQILTIRLNKIGDYHIVQPKETKYGIAKQYNLTLEEFEQNNPEIAEGLTTGAKVFVGKKGEKPNSIIPTFTNKSIKKEENLTKTKQDTSKIEKLKNNLNYSDKKTREIFYYVVKPKETLFKITDSLQISKEDLLKLNPELEDGLKAGMVLKYTKKNEKPAEKRIENLPKTKVVLQKTIKKSDSKKIALLLPFNLARMQNDTLKTRQEYLKNDKLLNISLDFYAGALIAIDSARVMGLPITIEVFDTESSKNTSIISSIIKNNSNFSDIDVVVGPLQNNQALAVAQLLKNIPVISPLSNETISGVSNLYQAMPSSNYLKEYLLNYFEKNNENTLALIHSKKQGTRNFLTEKYPAVKIVELKPNGIISTESFNASLDTTKKNFVLLDAESVGMISSAVSLVSGKKNIQLAVFDGKNEAFDFENLYKRLVAIELLYPSVTRTNDTKEAKFFEKKYKKQNNVFPNEFAIRGFDVMFDTILRVFQEGGFEQSAQTQVSEQIESKFDYQQFGNTYINTGVYIQQFQPDYSIKTVK